MVKWLSACVAVFCSLLALGWVSSAKSVAVVTDVQGEVRLQRKGQTTAVTLDHTTFLGAGDRLQVAPHGHATLFSLRAPERTLDGNIDLVVAPPPARTPPAALPEELWTL